MAVDQEVGEGDDKSAKKAKLDSATVNLTSAEEPGANGASAADINKLDDEPRTIKPREHLFTRKEARTTLKQLKSDLEAKLDAKKLEREAEVKKLDMFGPARVPGQERKEGRLWSVLKGAVAEFEGKKLDIFNLDRVVTMCVAVLRCRPRTQEANLLLNTDTGPTAIEASASQARSLVPSWNFSMRTSISFFVD